MRRSGLPVALLVAALLPGALPAAGARPTLAVSQVHPFTVLGHRFRPGERVRVVLEAPTLYSVRRATAAATGSFTVRFPGVIIDRCAGWTVRATGSLRSRAALRSPALACPPLSGP